MEPNLSRRLSKELAETGLKDVATNEDFDLGQIEGKGETPKDINEKCLKICQDYISADWDRQTVDSIRVRRVTGGLTNQLYHCSIAEPDPTSKVPQEVAIRLYGPKYFDPTNSTGYERLPDTVISVMVSDNKLGTQVYGIFEMGQLQKYYKHRQFLREEQSNEKLVRQVFTKLAKIHAMKVPVKRHVNWIFEAQETAYKRAYERFDIKKEMEENDCQTLKNNDIRAEMAWVREICEKVGSPVVFTHTDFRSSNILITEPDDEIVICDFEYSAYAYRGQDFVNLLREWGRDQWDFKTIHKLPPEDSVFGPLVQIYVDECVRIHGKEWTQNLINTVEHILKEAKTFLLGSCLFGCLFFLKLDQNDPDGLPIARNVSMQQSEIWLKGYFAIKEKLIKQGIVQ